MIRGWLAGSRGRWFAISVALIVVLGVEVDRAFGVFEDTLFALSYRYGLDYGEGIVWQQALMMFGPHMYSPSPDLPFIVFHYPPLYHTLVRLLLPFGADPLFAGRLVSVVSTVVAAVAIGQLTALASRSPQRSFTVAVAITAGLLFVTIHSVRFWGELMRVDMLAIALGLVGPLVLVRSRCSLAGTTVALLICVATVYAKQTQLPAGVAVFLVALLWAPRTALIAAAIAGSVGLAVAAGLELSTGGFFKNILSYNNNPFNLKAARDIVWMERETFPLVLLMMISAVLITLQVYREIGLARLRRASAFDRRTLAEAVIVIHFMLACIASLAIMKDGGGSNYFLDLYASGCVLIGWMMTWLVTSPRPFCLMAAVLALTVLNTERRFYTPQRYARTILESDQLVKEIEAADRPVVSDSMVLLLRGGKPIIYEPAIVRVLVAGGKWDPAPLLAMIRDHGFAFALVYTSGSESGPVVTEALREEFPQAKAFQHNLTELTR